MKASETFVAYSGVVSRLVLSRATPHPEHTDKDEAHCRCDHYCCFRIILVVGGALLAAKLARGKHKVRIFGALANFCPRRTRRLSVHASVHDAETGARSLQLPRSPSPGRVAPVSLRSRTNLSRWGHLLDRKFEWVRPVIVFHAEIAVKRVIEKRSRRLLGIMSIGYVGYVGSTVSCHMWMSDHTQVRRLVRFWT